MKEWLKSYLIPLCSFQGETMHCYFALANLFQCICGCLQIFRWMQIYRCVQTYWCQQIYLRVNHWWICANIWMGEDRIPLDQLPAPKTQNPPELHFIKRLSLPPTSSPHQCCSCSPWQSSAWWQRWRSGGWRRQTARKRWEGRSAKQPLTQKHSDYPKIGSK